MTKKKLSSARRDRKVWLDRGRTTYRPAAVRRRRSRRERLKFMIVYDSLNCGLQAKRFADQLAQRCGAKGECEYGIWRGELLEFPGLAEEALKDAHDADFLIVSLRGDTPLPSVVRHWCEGHLRNQKRTRPALVALFDQVVADWSAVEATRYYLRALADELKVPFFAHAVCCSARTQPLRVRGSRAR